MKTTAKEMALGGVLAALALVIMCLVGLIPIATYVCPMLCALLCFFVYRFTNSRIAWAWYIAVAILSFLLAPDKEAALVFVFLGYYPIIQTHLNKRRLSVVFKLAFFNLSVFVLYTLTVYVLGLEAIRSEYADFGVAGLIVLLLLGNACFFMLDLLLNRFQKHRNQKK